LCALQPVGWLLAAGRLARVSETLSERVGRRLLLSLHLGGELLQTLLS
jgi:hypothetical protein